MILGSIKILHVGTGGCPHQSKGDEPGGDIQHHVFCRRKLGLVDRIAVRIRGVEVSSTLLFQPSGVLPYPATATASLEVAGQAMKLPRCGRTTASDEHGAARRSQHSPGELVRCGM